MLSRVRAISRKGVLEIVPNVYQLTIRAVNIILIVLKIVAGIIGRSQALIADGVHSISDLFTDVIVLLGFKIGRKEPDESHHFGHARIETMASGGVGVALMVTAGYIGVEAAFNIYHKVEYHPTPLALMAALYVIEYGTPLWYRTLRPFTRLVPREREEYLRGFESSRFYFRQRLLFPIRMLATTLCYSEPEQEAATGYEFPTIDRSGVGLF